MKLYNTLSKEVQIFEPSSGEVKLYSCGPTVYDYAHVGNLRAYVFVDTLRRALEAGGMTTRHVMNITDVGHLASDADEGDDKLESGAKRESKTVWEVAERFTEAFKNDVAELNILPPNGYKDPKAGDNYARATDFIDKQLEIVKSLLTQGFAYRTEQAIYFDTTKSSNYGCLTGQKLSDKEVGARQEVVTDASKRNPQDFALWFFTVGRFSNHSMRWESEFGEGFPGWHLECSAIVHATLGEPVDIHTGGVDHIGTHHTNEIAQTEAAFGKQLARFWLHNEHMLINGQKMSKSAGNFITLNDLREKKYDPVSLRLLFLQSHYRSQSNFSWESLDAASKFLNKLGSMSDMVWQETDEERTFLSGIESTKDRINNYIGNDLNTPEALAELADFASHVNSSFIGKPDVPVLKDFIRFVDSIFGLSLSDRPDIGAELKQVIKERQLARSSSDWDKAEELRDYLSKENISLRDTPDGTVWFRV